MKKYILSLLIIVAAAGIARGDRGGYTVPKAIIDAVVHEDNSWEITEYLFVNFSEPRHGIYKYIPTAFSYGFPGADGKLEEYKYRTVVDSIDVDGRTFKVEDDDTPAFNKIIIIGKEDLTLTGDVKYTISYRMRYLDDRYKGEDFLCHTLWGQGWNTQVDSLYFCVAMEKGFPAGFTKELNVYSGALGSKANADSVYISINEEENKIYGSVFNLPANHAITLSARMPEGYWEVPEKNNTPFYSLLAISGMMALVLIISFLKNRSKITRVVSFHPPAGMSSAEVGKVIDDSVDNCDLASLIPWMAHKGYLKIRELRDNGNSKPVLELTLNSPLHPDEPQYMQQFLEALFKKKGENTIRLDELGNRAHAINKVKDSINREYAGQRALTNTNTLMVWLWRILVFFIAWAVCCASFTGNFDQHFLGYTLFTSGVAMYVMGRRRRKAGVGYKLWPAKRKRKNMLMWGAIIVAVTGFNIFMINKGLLSVNPLIIAVALVLTAIVSYFTHLCVKSTPYRDQLMGELLGLRNFIETAESSRLKMLVDENPHYFYEILPYAIVFGLSDKWVAQFEHIAVKAPDWYVGKSIRTNQMVPQTVLSNMTTNFDSSIKGAVESATSSGGSWSWVGGLFSGGGHSFSGGGGGGGGGGSW